MNKERQIIMKKILSVVLAALMLMCVFTGCGEKTKTLDDIKAAGKLVVATSPDFPPFEELTSDGEVAGIEIDIMKLVCEKLGVELDIQTMDFDSVLLGVSSGKYDVAASGITVDEDRKKNMLFTDAYCMAAQAIVVKEGSAVAAKADLDGKKIAVQTATTAEKFCIASGYEVESYAANNDAQMALIQGKVEAWVIDDLTAAEMVAAYNAEHDDKLVILSEAMTTEPYAFALPFGSEEIASEINKIISELIDDGTIASIFEKFNAPYTSAK